MYMYHPVGGCYCYNYADPPKPINTYTYYQVLYNNTPGYLTFWVAGTKVFSQPNFFVPNEAQVRHCSDIHLASVSGTNESRRIL
jgi:hypothetical protein